MNQTPKISLLHATRGRPEQAQETCLLWLLKADAPNSIEHIYAYQDDDGESAQLADPKNIRNSKIVTTPPPPEGFSSSVSNWNAAAKVATGDILVVIADDLSPCDGWDTFLRQHFEGTTLPKILKVSDCENDNGLLRHPVFNRAAYQQLGYIFHPEFYGVYCDNHLTQVALDQKYYAQAEDYLTFCHRHKIHNKNEFDDAVTALQNSKKAYGYGRTVFDSLTKPVAERMLNFDHISTVWVGPAPGTMELLTLRSLIAHGHEVDLYTVKGLASDWKLPKGVNLLFLEDHFPDLPKPIGFNGIKHNGLPNGGIGSLAHWSDLVAWTVIANKGGAWIQMDVVRNKPLISPYYCFTPFAGGIQPICFTAPRGSKAAHQIARNLLEPTKQGWAGQDWHEAMAVQTRGLIQYRLGCSIFGRYYDCGGRPESPYNRPLLGDQEPEMIHWSNATNFCDKETPQAGSYYDRLVKRYGKPFDGEG